LFKILIIIYYKVYIKMKKKTYLKKEKIKIKTYGVRKIIIKKIN
jgi:hypothetical protein